MAQPTAQGAVGVFWDFENCALPSSAGAVEAENISRVARGYGFVKVFKAYLDLSAESSPRTSTMHSELQNSGMSLTDCPHINQKEVADKMMLVDMMIFALDNPPPATILIISGDRDFAYAMSTLRFRGYKVVVIAHSNVHQRLVTRADVVHDIDDVFQRLDPRAEISPSSPYTKGSRRSSFRSDNGRNGRASTPLSRQLPLPSHQAHTPADDHGLTVTVENAESDGLLLSAEQTPYLPSKSGKLPPIDMNVVKGTSVSEYNAGDVDSPAAGPSTSPVSPVVTYASRVYPTPSHSRECSTEYLPSQFLTVPCIPLSPRCLGYAAPDAVRHHGLSSPVEGPARVAVAAKGSTDQTGSSLEPIDPTCFSLLVDLLEEAKQGGQQRVLRSKMSLSLTASNPDVFAMVGVKRFKDYAALAVKLGIVELGGEQGSAWIALKPDWHDTVRF